jgi:hypothetical protein
MNKKSTKTIEKNQEGGGRSISFVLTASIRKILWQSWEELKCAGLIPMLLVVIVLSAVVKVYVGDLCIDTFNLARWLGIRKIVYFFLVILFLTDFFAQFSNLKYFRDPESGDIDIVALWKNVFTNPLSGIILITVMGFGITSAQSLSEYYRVYAKTWYDANLWALEASFFYSLKGSLIDIPRFWDPIYFAFWYYIIFVYCVLYRLRRFYDLGIMSIAAILNFFLARLFAIQYPTAGPAFYKLDFFDLSGSLSGITQKGLALYMKGGVPQNGFIPGTMGMPSLHIGITFMAAWFLTRNVRWTLWLSISWVFLTWMSTVMLGWHYVLDGVGGIVFALVSVIAARGMMSLKSIY